jgi:hypothetical protein
LGQYIGWTFDFPNNLYGQWLGAPSISVCSIVSQYLGYCQILQNDNNWHHYSLTLNASMWANSTMQQYLAQGIRIISYEAAQPAGSIMFDNIQVQSWEDVGNALL